MLAEKKDNWWIETRDFKKTRKEEYLDIDETLVELEKNSSIIRLELNSIELPLFSKDTKRIKNQIKVYHFKTDKSSFLEVEAPAGFSIPGEFEERVFITLTKIMKNNNYSRKFIITANELLENMGLSNAFYYKKIRDALTLLSKTNYTFANSLYSNKESGILDEKIMSSIMNISIISKKDKRAGEIECFEDGRIKEVYEISFTDYFYDNIIRKGYLAFDSEKLLSIENSVARAIYTIVEKWRGYDLYIRRQAFFIARRIPLKWDKTQIKRTIEVMERALIELQNLNLIKNFRVIKEKKWELAEIEITFDEFHNKTKRETFYAEKNEFSDREMLVTSTEEKIKCIPENIDDCDLSEILKLFPEKVLAMKTFESFIKESVEKHGFDYVKGTAEYTALKTPKSYKSYMSKALENNWADEYISSKKVKENKKLKSLEEASKTPELAEIIETPKHTWDEYINLSKDLQGEIEAASYEEFLLEAGSSHNKTMKNIFEKSKKPLILRTMEKYDLNHVLEESKVDTKKIETPIEEKTPSSNENEIIGQYVSIPQFMVKVSQIAKEKNIKIDFEHLVPIFKLFGEYEDEFIKISYDEGSKRGIITIK